MKDGITFIVIYSIKILLEKRKSVDISVGYTYELWSIGNIIVFNTSQGLQGLFRKLFYNSSGFPNSIKKNGTVLA